MMTLQMWKSSTGVGVSTYARRCNVYILYTYRSEYAVRVHMTMRVEDFFGGVSFPVWFFFFFFLFQIQDKLPHLKAIIQYKDALKEKKPNLYSVWIIHCMHTHTIFTVKIRNLTDALFFCRVCLSSHKVGGVYGTGPQRAGCSARWCHRVPETQSVLRADLHFRNHRAAEGGHAEPW